MVQHIYFYFFFSGQLKYLKQHSVKDNSGSFTGLKHQWSKNQDKIKCSKIFLLSGLVSCQRYEMCELTKLFVYLLLALTLVGKCSLFLIWGRCVTAVPWLPRPIYLLEYIAAFFPLTCLGFFLKETRIWYGEKSNAVLQSCHSTELDPAKSTSELGLTPRFRSTDFFTYM